MLFKYELINGVKTLPKIIITLRSGYRQIASQALVDSGSSINVLPYRHGLVLGLNWNSDSYRLKLTGNLSDLQAQPVFLFAKIGEYDPIRLAFAWTINDTVPLILGNTNFFDEFEVSFYRQIGDIEIKPNRRF